MTKVCRRRSSVEQMATKGFRRPNRLVNTATFKLSIDGTQFSFTTAWRPVSYISLEYSVTSDGEMLRLGLQTIINEVSDVAYLKLLPGTWLKLAAWFCLFTTRVTEPIRWM